MLQLDDIRAGYRNGPDIISDVTLHVDEGEVVSLLGLNGAGKSTLARTAAGLLRTRQGRIVFEGKDLAHRSCDRRARAGLVLVPEGRELFSALSVEDNLRLGTLARSRASRAKDAATSRAEVYELFPALNERSRQPAGSLSGGQQQMVAIGRALMSRPKLLILDEPSLGLAPQLVTEIFRSLKLLSEQGMSILLIEQNEAAAAVVSTRAYRLHLGRSSEVEDYQGMPAQELTLRTADFGVGTVLEELPALPEYSYAGRRARRAKAESL